MNLKYGYFAKRDGGALPERGARELYVKYCEALREAQWARNDLDAIATELDALGAPKLQPSGLPYSVLGRLKALRAA